MNSPKEDTNTVTSTTDKMQLRFIFANRDGVSVEIECSPTDTVETMKSALISEWPKEIDDISPSPDRIRLICMGKGILSPESACIEQFDLPVFLTHPTPINVSVKPVMPDNKDSRRSMSGGGHHSSQNSNGDSSGECCCVIS
jgi:hypothetical protein